MTTEDNKTAIRRLANIINSGDLSSLHEVVDENISYRSSAGETVHGIEEFKALLNNYHRAFTNLEISPQEMVSEGDKLFGLYRQTGTHTDEIMGIPAKNCDVDLLVSSVCTFKDGKLVEEYDIYDTLDFMRQLDALPEELATKLPGVRA